MESLLSGCEISDPLWNFKKNGRRARCARGSLSRRIVALVYLRRRSALEPITAHAFSGVLAMLGATMQAS
jgi:hypothetical protein